MSEVQFWHLITAHPASDSESDADTKSQSKSDVHVAVVELSTGLGVVQGTGHLLTGEDSCLGIFQGTTHILTGVDSGLQGVERHGTG